ncbi:hypothetical protein [Christiangramia aestuarii]|uniref:Uncharacterized protein n=1 Tax=Christiangramia aestuarii TaxID=1028746 RepID=A0A7K1LRQ3_9FLAO|nr:hypothetical protein [Christiangramia aestuarii]MUP43477.1 hypothetical protein [Christiangramia aestuarii]
MKRILLYIGLAISLFLVIQIIAILFTGIQDLTQYGYGFLTGKIILLLVLGTILYFNRKHLRSGS